MNFKEEELKQKIALTTWDQLGGAAFGKIIGANHFEYGEDDNNSPFIVFYFNVHQKTRRCKVTLMPEDLYKIDFMEFQGDGFKTVFSVRNLLYCMLREQFDIFIGLMTRADRVIYV